MFADIGGIVDHHPMSWGERWFLLILVELLTSLNELKWEVIFVDIGEIVDHHSMYWGEMWFLLILVMVNNFTNINKNHLSPQLIEWNCWPSFNELKWEVIFVDIGVIIDITQWVDVRGNLCWYWWNCLPSLNELRWEVIFVDIGGIVDHHSMSWGERWFLLILVKLLTITQCIEMKGDFCWYWWWSTIPPISTKITSHLNSLSDGQQFHQYQQKSPLTLTHWVELLTITQWVQVRGDFCWYWWNCWPSLNELRWEVIFVDIGGIVDHHSMWLGERWFLLILVMVNNSTNIIKNHLSP